MDTPQEALFRQMMLDGWFTESDGDSDSHVGYFGYVSNIENELPQLRAEFAETIKVYSDPGDKAMIGNFVCVIDSNGVFRITRYNTFAEAKNEFRLLQREYETWAALNG